MDHVHQRPVPNLADARQRSQRATEQAQPHEHYPARRVHGPQCGGGSLPAVCPRHHARASSSKPHAYLAPRGRPPGGGPGGSRLHGALAGFSHGQNHGVYASVLAPNCSRHMFVRLVLRLDAMNQAALSWCREVASRSIHGTTHRRPFEVFQAEEKPATESLSKHRLRAAPGRWSRSPPTPTASWPRGSIRSITARWPEGDRCFSTHYAYSMHRSLGTFGF